LIPKPRHPPSHEEECCSLGQQLNRASKNFVPWQLRGLIVRMSDKRASGLTRKKILKAFQEMSDELKHRGVTGERCLFGGTVMVLAFSARISTKDVDAIFQPTQEMRNAARSVGAANGFEENWLNDAVKGFVSARHETIQGSLPQFSHLRLTMPTPEYLLAMKCMASRIGAVRDEADDVNDIIFLIRHLKLKSSEAVMDIVTSYYPKNKIPLKAQYLVEGLYAEGKICFLKLWPKSRNLPLKVSPSTFAFGIFWMDFTTGQTCRLWKLNRSRSPEKILPSDR
jgi:Nucleotidyltransferase of unknown function (DUF6036)